MAGAATLFAEGGWYAGSFALPLLSCVAGHLLRPALATAEPRFAAALPFVIIAAIVTCGFSRWIRGLDERVGVPCERFV